MSIEISLRNHLLTDANVTALVDNRIYPGKLPPTTEFPAITYAKASGRELLTCDGPEGTAQARIRLRICSDTYQETLDTFDVVRDALHGHTGELGDHTAALVSIEDDSDTRPMPKAVGSADSRYRRTISVMVWYYVS